MSDEPLLTLRQVALELALPESTTRYYRDAFLDHIPFVGMGRRRRYPPSAVAILRSVAEGFASGHSRERIRRSLDGGGPSGDGAEPDHAGPGPRPQAEITNLELLAAIVDGEREQRDALWQMATEIVRLTSVLEGQDRILTELAGHAGLAEATRPALDSGPQPAPRALGDGRGPGPALEPVAPPTSAPPPSPSELERLRAELESERELVERLREAKVKLEHRVTHAEDALEERGPPKRPSVLDRILRPDGNG